MIVTLDKVRQMLNGKLLKVLYIGLLLFINLHFSSLTPHGMTSNSYKYSKVVVNKLRLSTWNSTQYVDEDFFFYANMNITLLEWIDESRMQKPPVIDGPVLELYQNTIGLAFDGEDDVIIVPNSDSLNSINEFTIELWTKFSSYGSRMSGRDWFTLVCKGSIWSKASYCLLFAANTTSRGLTFILNGMKVASAKTFAKNNIWYHIVATYNGSLVRIFLNGELVASAPFNNKLIGNNENLYIGSEKEALYPMNGILGSIRIYNYTLSQNEVKLLYQTKTLVQKESLILNLNFDNLKYAFERSTDGNNFYEVFKNDIENMIIVWRESQVGK